MPCWKCTACGQTVCDLEECPTCNGNGRSIKREVREQKLKDNLSSIDQYPVGLNETFFNTVLGVPFKDSEIARCEVCGKLTKGRLVSKEPGKRKIPFCITCHSEGLFEKYESEYIYESFQE